jgi:NADH-quinone oxidoreductase subunit L
VLDHAPKESPWVVTLPLMLLAIPVAVRRLLHRRADAVRQLVRRRDPCERGEQRAGRSWARSSTVRWRWRCKGSAQLPFGLVALAFVITTYIYLFNPAMAGKIKSR